MDMINCPNCGEEMPCIIGQENKCPKCQSVFYDHELGECERRGNIDLLSDEGYCNYCQHVWDSD